jgi:hypothetical protein
LFSIMERVNGLFAVMIHRIIHSLDTGHHFETFSVQVHCSLLWKESTVYLQ